MVLFEISFAWLLNMDSILIYSHKRAQFRLFNKHLSVLKTYIRPKALDTSIFRPSPLLAPNSLPQYVDSILYYTGFVLGETYNEEAKKEILSLCPRRISQF